MNRCETLIMIGPFVHRRYAPRHAVAARFEYWRVRLLAATYARCPLLAGLSGAP